MRTEISLEDIHREHEFRRYALEHFKTQARETRRQELDRIKTSLRPREYNESLYQLRGERSSGTGNWFFSSKAFTEWFDISRGDFPVLWLKGIPGAGKWTTLLTPTRDPAIPRKQEPEEVHLDSARSNARAAYD